MDPISAGIQGVASVIGGLFSNNQSKKNRQFQREENQKTRDFNHAEAELARQYNTEMWNKTNEYNSPSAQINRLSAAGLNPDMIYGDMNALTSASIGSTSQQASAGHTATPVMADPSYFANIGKTIAETELLRSQSQKLKSETENQDIVNKYEDELRAGAVKLQGVEIDLKNSQKNLTDEQVKVAAKSLKVMDQQIDSLKAQAADFYASVGLKESQSWHFQQLSTWQSLANSLFTETFQAQVKDIIARSNYNQAMARFAPALFTAQIYAANQQAFMAREQGRLFGAQADRYENENTLGIAQLNVLARSTGIKFEAAGTGLRIAQTHNAEAEGVWIHINNAVDNITKVFDSVKIVHTPKGPRYQVTQRFDEYGNLTGSTETVSN